MKSGEEWYHALTLEVRIDEKWYEGVDDLVLCDEWEEDLKAMVWLFFEVRVCNGRYLKVIVDKNKVMVSGEEEGSICEVLVGGTQFEYVSEFIYLGAFWLN